jgi:uncharacterized protein
VRTKILTEAINSIADRLRAAITRHDRLAIAVSGGVDSMTLAAYAHAACGAAVHVYHAVSPAVPPRATERVQEYAARLGWALTQIDANEFADPNYLANPANRCFYCKQNLYGAIRAATVDTIASGTNRDDLGDFRPGLTAAAQYGVVHPFVEADLDKAAVRGLARAFGLHDLAELPASPCLSSRVETGIPIRRADLTAIDAAERLVAERLAAATVRCRVRGQGVVIELDAAALERLDSSAREQLTAEVAAQWHGAPVSFAPYRMGSAFLHPRTAT